ncbi:hypothetical protein [Bradyrhizobium sp. ARR65]|uniref:ATP-dependent DNA ligase n=1 Tax=Bradyrhizobium sp. ARR65 TaxID=1040989 RepID=UPI0032DFA05A
MAGCRIPQALGDGNGLRLITRGGYNWTDRYPWIVEAPRKVRQKRFVLDGEAVVLVVDGVSAFNALHSRKHDHEVQFCAFDILVEGELSCVSRRFITASGAQRLSAGDRNRIVKLSGPGHFGRGT